MKHSLQVTLALFFCASVAFAQNAAKGEIDDFVSKTSAIPTIDQATNSLSFLRFPVGRAYKINAGDVQQKSMTFLSENAKLFGLRANEDIYRFKEQKTDNYGLDNVTLQQTYKGVPVYDGLLKFHYNKNKDLTSLNGNFISGIKINVVPTLAQGQAEAIAIKYVTGAKIEEPVSPLRAKKSALYIFQKGLVQGYNGPKSLVYEVEVVDDVNIREFLYINAHDGSLVEQFTGIHSINRELYETSYTSANLKWKEDDTFPGALDQWQQSEVESAGFIYNLMKNTFGWVSYNGADAKMITVNNDPGIACPNANWNGTTANYCTGIASDDVVAHEWGHAYTEYTSGLVYAWQSGAMNEAYSDIWGETVDQMDNNYFDTGENNALRTGCGSSVRWALGEQTTGGAIRDMWNPNCYGDPGRVSDPLYWCSSVDNGGVHINSGILNHTYALLVDGGTYNGQTITGIGLTKAAHVFWRAQTLYMTSTTDFAAQADILEAAMSDLIESEANLESLSTTLPTGPSGQTMTVFDLLQLQRVLLAVELRADNFCGFQPLLKPVTALCEGANSNLALFYENFESGLHGFTVSALTSSSTWAIRNWVLAPAPAGRPGTVAFGIDYDGGNCTTSVQAGIIRLQSPLITIPAGTAGNLNMAFDHYVAIEEGWDGGNIKYSINGEAWTLLPQTAFTANGYNNVLNAAAAGNDNPLQGQRAFSGSNGGTVEGSWGQSQIDLTSIGLAPGNTIQFRWELGTDGCGGINGWYVDDIKVYTCAVTPAVHFVLENAAINEGEGTTASGTACLDYVDKTFAVRIDKAPTQPVTVTFNTPTGTAKMGPTADYTILSPSVTLQAGSLIQNVTVRVYNDAYVEEQETIDLSYSINSNGGNGYTAASHQHLILTITDDDLPPGNYTEDLLVSGFNLGPGGWEVKNGGNSADTWGLVSYSNAALDPAGRPFFFVNSGPTNFGIIMQETLESPVINSAGKKNMVLTFSQDWNPYRFDYPEQGIVEIWDGSTWQNVLTQVQTSGRLGNILTYTPNIQTINIPDAYANVNMKIRFRYLANWDGWWAVDNVKLTSSNSTSVLSAVNTANPAQQYLGPNETAVFYDPGTGNLIAKIKNLSAFDYGCTTVEVDRAGNNATPWLGTYFITNKTFKVTPTNNNPGGNYEITLYYKASELTTFQSQIKSMAKSEGGIGGTSVATVLPSPAFGSDYAYTATFSTGFSGFGLTDAPVVPLPVTLTKFEGRNTTEGNLLNWATTTEVNNEYFAVEKSLTGKNFMEIGRVAGIGNSAVINDYKFLDTNYPKGIIYYRLKQVDKDGKYAYSRIVSIDALNARDLKFFPNPVQSVLTMELPDQEMKSVNVRVINAAGQEVFSRQKVSITKGSFDLNIATLPTGIYQVILSGEKTNYNLSVLKL